MDLGVDVNNGERRFATIPLELVPSTAVPIQRNPYSCVPSSRVAVRGKEAGVVPPAGSPALNSWKEIAVYVGRGVRTVQRWERELGLPVRRPHKHLRSPVIAIPAELDEWLRRGKPRQEGQRRAITTSQIVQTTRALNDNLKLTCERTEQLSETIRRTIARIKIPDKTESASSGRLAS